MATDPMQLNLNLANYAAVVWSKEVLADTEDNLVMGKLVDRRFEAMLASGGYTVAIPNMHNMTVAAVNTLADMTLYDVVQNITNITVNINYDTGVAVDDIAQWLMMPNYFDLVKSKASYAIAEQIDLNIGALVGSFATTTGTEGTALNEDNLIAAYEGLNTGNAPAKGRAWVFDPESITDLLKCDYFVRMDYVPGSVVENGFQGRQIFGSPVYMSTNVAINNTSYHKAGYWHKEAIAMILKPVKVEVFRLGMRHSWVISVLASFGLKEMRDLYGVYIKTRS